MSLIEQAWARVLDRDPVLAMRLGRPVDALPSGGIEMVAADATGARHDLARWARLDDAPRADLDRLSAAFVRDHLAQQVAEEQRFRYRIPVTPYNVSVLGDYRSDVFGALPLDDVTAVERYLGLLDDYVEVVVQLRVTVHEQRQRGIMLPGWALAAAVDAVRGQAAASTELLPTPARCGRLGTGAAGQLRDGAARTVQGPLATAFDALLTELADNGVADGVGIGQYPGGAACYDSLIELHTGLDLSAEQIHRIGMSEVDRLTEKMRSELDIADEAAYRNQLTADPRCHAADPDELARILQGHVERVGDELGRWFGGLPTAPFRLRRLDPALEGGLTFGYYQPPGADGYGCYFYNGSDLADRPLVQAASVLCHEGIPGHHLQIGRQLENDALHPIRRQLSNLRTFATNGFLEGWAEYAAGFCDEVGLYPDPFDRYGRLSSERFQAARLVVDTGLNVLGWSRQRAAGYLRANAFLSEVEIGTELVRYAVDDPGQALGYHLGHWYLRRLRGDTDPLSFHNAVLDAGQLPLRLLPDALDLPQPTRRPD